MYCLRRVVARVADERPGHTHTDGSKCSKVANRRGRRRETTYPAENRKKNKRDVLHVEKTEAAVSLTHRECGMMCNNTKLHGSAKLVVRYA